MASLVGSRVERKEDGRFLQGKGRYTADINIANQTYAVFVRSPHARAKIKGVDTSKALKSSGVVGVLTGKEIAEDKIGGLIAGWAIRSEDGSEMKVPAIAGTFISDPSSLLIAQPAINPPILSSAISFPVNTPTTPDDFNAFEVSTPLIFALACGDLTNTAYV